MSKTTIPTAGLADSAVTSAKITDGTIATDDIADSAVTAAKTSGVATDLQAVADGSAGSPSIANSGDTNTGIFFSAADQVAITTAGNLNSTFLGNTTPQEIRFNHSGGGDGVTFYGPGSGEGATLRLVGFEARGATCEFYQDQGDDNGDRWSIGQGAQFNGVGTLSANDAFYFTQYNAGSTDNEAKLTNAGNWSTEGSQSANTNVDYAEFFEWKTELASDDKIVETYGMTVVLDGDKVRLAEAGEEAKVIGVIRPNDTSAMVGGSQSLKWKDKYEKDVWGVIVQENYTQITWMDDGVKHSYAKDKIPSGITPPSTDEEKTEKKYVERNTYARDKGAHKKGDLLMRNKLNSSYDESKVYIPREERRKEWAIVGLLGQVEIRDTAIIPTTWTKMKNVGTGIDLYFIK